MNLTLTWNTPSTLIQATSPKRQSTGTLPNSARELCRTVATRAYFEKEINNHTQEEKKLFGTGEACCQNVSHSFKVRFVFLQLFSALTESILWPRKPSSTSVTLSLWSSKEFFQFGGIKLWHKQDIHQRLKRRGKNVQFAVFLQDWLNRATETHMAG